MAKDSPLIGKPAPQLELPVIPDGKPFKLPLGEKPIALFFFPEAGTKGCTMEACSFRDARASNAVFARHPDLEVVGISGDGLAKQAKFADEHGLGYPLLSDAHGDARKAYGVGKAFFGLSVERMTVFIDAAGVVRGVLTANIDMYAHAKFVEKQLSIIETEKQAAA
ncbi:hypothetical protein Q5752_002244 [Cryptotrichosporon argae]